MRMAAALRRAGPRARRARDRRARAAGQPIGRPHLAEAVLACPANAPRLQRGAIDDIGSLIRAYLIEGRPAFRLRQTPTVAEAIEAIHDAGGVAVWAHPFWDVSDPAEALATIDRFRALGIDGVEAFYVTHTREQTELLAERCASPRPAQHRLLGLPRAGQPPVLALPGVRHLRPRTQPRDPSPERSPEQAEASPTSRGHREGARKHPGPALRRRSGDGRLRAASLTISSIPSRTRAPSPFCAAASLLELLHSAVGPPRTRAPPPPRRCTARRAATAPPACSARSSVCVRARRSPRRLASGPSRS